MIDIRRARERFHTDLGWLDSWHSFSFGAHHDPHNTHHGLVLVSNDDRVAPGGGFPTHAHRDMEIVTWVIEGRLEHRDSEGNHGIVYPGLAQRMSAGSGIRHSEMNASDTEPVRFVQMWVLPDRRGAAPGYEQIDVTDRLAAGGLVAVASGQGHDGAVTLGQTDAVLRAGRLAPDEVVEVPAAPHGHLFVAKGTAVLGAGGFGGSAELAGAALVEGDAVRLTGEAALGLQAGPEGAEVLIWATA